MASFAKPISRATADRLVAGLLERTTAWNANPDRFVSVDEVVIFGSYLDPTIDRLGDVDVTVRLRNWAEQQSRDMFNKSVQAYSRASGRTFASFLDMMLWPKKEAIQHLRNRSTALNITTEDVRTLTKRSAWAKTTVRQLLMTTDPVIVSQEPDAMSAAIAVPGRAVGPLIGGSLFRR